MRKKIYVTAYDIGGKLLSSTKYPYGIFTERQSIREDFQYDNQGRVSLIKSKNGHATEAPVANYQYYPTGEVKKIILGSQIELSYTYHISGALKTAEAKRLSDSFSLFSETLYYEDCGKSDCKPQYNGNISRMVHKMAVDGDHERRSDYTYDFMNRLIFVEDLNDEFDESFAYDMQGRITVQRRGSNAKNGWGGEYSYYKNSNADKRNMNVSGNFVYDTTGNLIEDKYLQGESSKNALVHFYCRTAVYCALRNSKRLKISYDWRGMPVEFVRETCTAYGHYTVCDSTKLVMAYDGSGRRVSKTRMKKTAFDMPGGTLKDVRVVVNMPQGLGRYGIEDAADAFRGVPLDENGKPTSWSALNPKFEWYLKNHLGSTMLVYGTQWADHENLADVGAPIAAYDYRAFGEQINLVSPSSGKVTENFTGKEKDDETQLNYFGARYLDPMLGMWTSVDPARQFASPYLYAGNGVNPVNVVDPNGNYTLNLNEDNTVAGLVDDGNLNMVSVLNADGSLFGEYNAPPKDSYFFTENLTNQVFDPNMQLNADAMVKDASQYWPLDFWGWGTKGPSDFKNSYYFGAGKTVGALNNTIMTARDAGNAIWGGWARHMYLNNATAAALLVGGITPAMLLTAGFCSTTEGQRLLMQGISNIVATNGKVYINGSKEDPSSAVMQDWGFDNYKP